MKIQATQQTQPNAVKKTVKTAAATVATAAVATGAVLYLAKTGKLDKFAGKNAKVDTAIDGLKGAADKVSKKLSPKVELLKNSQIYKKAESSVKKVANFATEKFGAVSDIVKTRLGKFNPDLAPAKEKMAETFNNFVK